MTFNTKQMLRLFSGSTERIISIIPPALLVVLNVFLFLPHSVYERNATEILVPLGLLLTPYIVPSIAVMTVISVPAIILREKFFRVYVAFIFVLGFLIWLQGNILIWNYGLIGKGDINWASHPWRGWVDSFIWISVGLAGAYYFNSVFKLSRFLSFILIGLQIAIVVITGIRIPEIWKASNDFSLLTSQPEAIYQFSSKQNVIHVVLDEFQTDVFQKIIDNNPDYYFNALDGFTFFKEASGLFPTTLMSVPAFTTTKTYDNAVPIAEFIDEAYRGPTTSKELMKHGFSVDSASSLISPYSKDKFTNFFYIPIPFNQNKGWFIDSNSSMLMRLVVFRAVPHFFKKYVFDSRAVTKKLSSRNTNFDITAHEAERHLSHKHFLKELTEKMSVTRPEPVYKIIHLNTTHYPAVLNESCEYSGEVLPWTWKNITIQDKCSLDAFIAFLNKLKAFGIYDSSLIIVHADHGYWHMPDSSSVINMSNTDKIRSVFDSDEHFAQAVCSSRPLLAIKRPNSKGLLAISSAPVMLTDIPATITSELKIPSKFPGLSAFDIDESMVRERPFNYYDELKQVTDTSFDKLYKFTVSGNFTNIDSWHLANIAHENNFSYATKMINFGTDAATPFLRSGWGGNESVAEHGAFNWSLGKKSTVFLSLPKDKAVQLKARVKYNHIATPQKVTIKVDGKVVGNVGINTNPQWQNLSIIVPSEPSRPDISVVEFMFSTVSKPSKLDPRLLAMMFGSLEIATKDFSNINFGTDETVGLLQKGWGLNEASADGTKYNWALGRSATIALPLPRDRQLQIAANLKSLLDKPQKVIVKIDGKNSGTWTVSSNGQWEKHSISVAPDSRRRNESVIEFVFSDFIKPSKNDARALALLFNKIEIR